MDEIFCISNKTLYSEQSGSRIIEICEDLDNRWMNFGDGFVQSAMSLHHPETLVLPYMQAMMAPLLFTPVPQKLLLLGLGAGALVRFFQHYLSETKIIAVENDSSVVRLANRYFELPAENALFHIHIADADEFIRVSKLAVDWLMVDLFCDGTMPEDLKSAFFLQQCQKQLSSSGVLILNLIPEDEAALSLSIKQLREIFDKNVLCCQVKGYKNVILFAFNKKPVSQTYVAFEKKSKVLQKQYGLHFKTWLDNLFEDNPNEQKGELRESLELNDLFLR